MFIIVYNVYCVNNNDIHDPTVKYHVIHGNDDFQ